MFNEYSIHDKPLFEKKNELDISVVKHDKFYSIFHYCFWNRNSEVIFVEEPYLRMINLPREMRGSS